MTGEGATVSKQRRCPCRFVVVVAKAAKKSTMTMRLGRRNLLSFVGEIEPRSNNLESRFCEISGDVP